MHGSLFNRVCSLSSECFVFRLCHGRSRPLESSANHDPLTQGDGLNANHDGSSTERDVPNELCAFRNKSLSRELKQPTFFLSVHSCKHGIGQVRR